MTEVPRLGIFEHSFVHSGNYSNPYTQATATATFTRPGGVTQQIPLFWDGGKTWKVRFSPSLVGNWSWSINSNDPGLDGKSGSFTTVESNNKGGIIARPYFPNHFRYQDGSPFWWMGDTGWTLYSSNAQEKLNRSTAFDYIDARSFQGFNVVHSQLIDGIGWGNEGGKPFNSFSSQTVNPEYWQEVDARLAYLNRKGITAGLTLAWGGDKREEKVSWEDFPSNEARLDYARYVAARYSAYNVYFLVAGEWNFGGPRSWYEDIGKEIQNQDPHNRLIGIHPGEGGSFSVEEFNSEPWMSFGDYQQSYSALHSRILVARDRNKPVINSEYAYYLRDKDGDGSVDKANSYTLTQIRDASWDIAMAGGYFVTGFGSTYYGGYRDPGPFSVNAAKNDDWEDDVQHIHKLFTDLQAWKLQPKDNLLSGPGTHYALAEPGQQYVAYVRDNSGTNTLSLGDVTSATYSVKRFDPRTGTYTSLPNYSGNGSVNLDSPDSQDWAYVLERIGEGNPEPPAGSGGNPKPPAGSGGNSSPSKPGTVKTLSFTPEANTFIEAEAPTTNYGGENVIEVGGGTTRREIFMRFNVTGLPLGATVSDAQLILEASNTSKEAGGGGVIREFAPQTIQWDEQQPTWNNSLAGNDVSGDLATLGPVAKGNTYRFENLQSVIDGNGQITFVIRSTKQDGVAYQSGDADSSQRPILQITYQSNGSARQFKDGGSSNLEADYITGQPQIGLANPDFSWASNLSTPQSVSTILGQPSKGILEANAVKMVTAVDYPSRGVLSSHDTSRGGLGLTTPDRQMNLLHKDNGVASLLGQGGALFDATLDWAIAQLPA